MTLPNFAAVAAAILLLASCTNTQRGDISEYPDPTPGDSLLFYYGQLRAYEYMREADNDTSLRSRKQRDEFLAGVKAGLKTIREGDDDDNYNRGVRLGVRMGIRLLRFEKQYGITLNEHTLFSSLAYGLEDETDINPEATQKAFYKVFDQIKLQKLSEDKKKSRLTLVEVARRHQMVKISDQLYCHIEHQGSGHKAQPGELVYVTVDYTYANGEDLGFPSPEFVRVGSEGMPHVMTEAYSQLADGATALFATTALDLFGNRIDVLGIPPSEVILISITVNNIEQSTDSLGLPDDQEAPDA